MRKMILCFMALLLITGIAYSQEDKEVKKEEKKTIIIKTVDEDGKVLTEILEGDEAEMEGARVWVTEEGDSIKVEVEVETDGETKKIKKRIRIEDFEGLKELEGLEGLEGLENIEKDIHIYRFDDEFGAHAPHILYFDELEGHHAFPGGNVFKFHDGPQKARLGVMIEDDEKGVKVTEVVENSSAWSVGILAGDVITHVDGVKMTNVEELQRAITDHEVGDMAEIKLKRNGKTKKFTARLQRASQNNFEFRMPEGFHDGMKRMKHHLHRGIEGIENHPRFEWKHKSHDCDKKCTGDHKHDCKKEIIIDKELKFKEKHEKMKKHKMKMEEKMMQMEEERAKEFEMQQKEKEILEREIEKSEEDSNNK